MRRLILSLHWTIKESPGTFTVFRDGWLIAETSTDSWETVYVSRRASRHVPKLEDLPESARLQMNNSRPKVRA